MFHIFEILRYTNAAFGVSKNFTPYRYPLKPVVQSVDGQLHIVQYGNIVTINGYVNNISVTADNDTIIATIDTTKIHKPSIAVRTLCSIGSYAYRVGDIGFLGISSDTGNIYVRSKEFSGTASIFVSCSYTIEG